MVRKIMKYIGPIAAFASMAGLVFTVFVYMEAKMISEETKYIEEKWKAQNEMIIDLLAKNDLTRALKDSVDTIKIIKSYIKAIENRESALSLGNDFHIEKLPVYVDQVDRTIGDYNQHIETTIEILEKYQKKMEKLEK